MKKRYLKTTLALAVMSAGLAAVPAQAVQINFTGGSNLLNLETVTGDDTIGDTWQTHNDVLLGNSNFAMADFNAAPQPFNPGSFSNGLGTFATAFQLTVNKSQAPTGFQGISLVPGGTGLVNNFTVMSDVGNPATWTTWNITYNLPDANGFFQQILFTAPGGTMLSQGTNFAVNVNIAGIFTNDSGWAASWDDRGVAVIPEPETYALMLAGLGLLGFYSRRRKQNTA